MMRRVGVVMSLRKRAFLGMQWNLAGSLSTGVVTALVMVVLARLVDPAEFGVMAFAQLSVSFVHYFSNLGVAPALIRSKNLNDETVHAAFEITVVFSFLLGIGLWLFAPHSVHIMNSSKLPWVIRVMGVNFFISGLGIVNESLLRRRMKFGSLAICQTVPYVSAYLFVGIPMAFLGFGVWALVSALISQSVIRVAMLWFIAPHTIRINLNIDSFKEILGFGSQHSVAGFIEFLGNSVDRFCVGKFLGASTLGVYTRGLNLVNVPNQYLGVSIARVLFPGFSEAQETPERLKNGYLKGSAVCCMLMFSFAMAMVPVARQVIVLVLGEKWVDAWPAFVGYGFIGWMGLMGSISITVIDVIGRQYTKIFIHLVVLIFMVLAVIWAVLQGNIIYVILAVAIGHGLRMILAGMEAKHLLGIQGIRFDVIAGGLYAGSVFFAVVWMAAQCFSQTTVWLWLPLALLVGAGLILLGVCFLRIPFVSDLAEIVTESYPVLYRVPLINRVVERICRR